MLLMLSLFGKRITISSNVTQYVAMPVGIIKGALARMGYQATVTTEIVQLPQCKLSVKDIYSLL